MTVNTTKPAPDHAAEAAEALGWSRDDLEQFGSITALMATVGARDRAAALGLILAIEGLGGWIVEAITDAVRQMPEPDGKRRLTLLWCDDSDEAFSGKGDLDMLGALVHVAATAPPAHRRAIASLVLEIESHDTETIEAITNALPRLREPAGRRLMLAWADSEEPAGR